MPVPATFQDIRNAVIKKLRLDATNDVASVNDWINIAYMDAAMETEWFQTAATMTLTGGSSAYTIPAAVARIKNLTIRPSGSNLFGRPLDEVSLDEIQDLRYTGATVVAGGSSSHYAIVGAQEIDLWPVPLAGDVLRMYYIYLPTALSANGDIPQFPEPYGSKVLEYGALAEASDFRSDPNENNYRQMQMFWQRKLRQHKNRIAGGKTWQLQIANGRFRYPIANDVDVRG